MLVASRSRQTLVRTISPYWIYIAASVKKKRKCGHIHSLIVKVHIVRSMNSFILKMKHRKYKMGEKQKREKPRKVSGTGKISAEMEHPVKKCRLIATHIYTLLYTSHSRRGDCVSKSTVTFLFHIHIR